MGGTTVAPTWQESIGEMYLPPATAAGCPYCFDPDSAGLRQALSQPRPRGETPLPSARLAEDVDWLHRLLRRQYAGYVDLLRQPQFEVEAFFAAWKDAVRRAGAALPFRAAIIEPLTALRLAVPDRHLTFWGADPLVDVDERIALHEYQAMVGGGAQGDRGGRGG